MNQVKSQITTCMAQMATVVHGNAAHIHRHLSGLERGEIHFFSTAGIVHANGHGLRCGL